MARTSYSPPGPGPEEVRSDTAEIPWTNPRVTVLVVGPIGSITWQARSKGAKHQLLSEAIKRRRMHPHQDRVFVAWPGRQSQDIFELDEAAIGAGITATKPAPSAAEREAAEFARRVEAMEAEGFTRDEAVALLSRSGQLASVAGVLGAPVGFTPPRVSTWAAGASPTEPF